MGEVGCDRADNFGRAGPGRARGLARPGPGRAPGRAKMSLNFQLPSPDFSPGFSCCFGSVDKNGYYLAMRSTKMDFFETDTASVCI